MPRQLEVRNQEEILSEHTRNLRLYNTIRSLPAFLPPQQSQQTKLVDG